MPFSFRRVEIPVMLTLSFTYQSKIRRTTFCLVIIHRQHARRGTVRIPVYPMSVRRLFTVLLALTGFFITSDPCLLTDVLTFHCGENRGHLQHRIAHLRGRVEHVFDALQRHAVALQGLQGGHDVTCVTAEPRKTDHKNMVDFLAVPDGFQHLLEPRTAAYVLSRPSLVAINIHEGHDVGLGILSDSVLLVAQ